MAQVDGQVDLVWLADVELGAASLLHEHSDKFVANLWRMLCILRKTELIPLSLLSQVLILLNFETLTFDLFVPTELVKALTEEESVGNHDFVEALMHLPCNLPQVNGEDFVH